MRFGRSTAHTKFNLIPQQPLSSLSRTTQNPQRRGSLGTGLQGGDNEIHVLGVGRAGPAQGPRGLT